MRQGLNRVGKSKFNFRPLILLILITMLIIAFIICQDKLILKKHSIYESTDLPMQYDNFKIVHITNIDNEKINILSKVKSIEPSIVLISGGFVDNKGNFQNSVNAVNRISEKYNTYYVLQENDLKYSNEIRNNLKANYLDNEIITVNVSDIDINNYIEDNYDKGFVKELNKDTEESKEFKSYMNEQLNIDKNRKIQIVGLDGHVDNIEKAKDSVFELMKTNTNAFNIMLLGNVDESVNMNDIGLDIVLCGGTYGLDKYEYTNGIYTVNDFGLFVSNGVCSNIPESKRFMNFPSIQYLQLSDTHGYKRNPLEKFLGLFIKDVGTIFDNDKGFTEHRYEYGGLEVQD